MDMGSLLRTISGTILKHKRDPNVHPERYLGKANIDSSSYEVQCEVTGGQMVRIPGLVFKV